MLFEKIEASTQRNIMVNIMKMQSRMMSKKMCQAIYDINKWPLAKAVSWMAAEGSGGQQRAAKGSEGHRRAMMWLTGTEK